MDLAQVFLSPRNATHRQYEALRAYYVERLPASEVAKRFGYTEGSVRQLAHQLRGNPQREFFREATREISRSADPVRDQIIQLRKQNLSIYDISEALQKEGIRRSAVAVSKLLSKEGFATGASGRLTPIRLLATSPMGAKAGLRI